MRSSGERKATPQSKGATYRERQTVAAAFGSKSLGSVPDADGFMSGAGRYVLLHFELATRDADHLPRKRDDELEVIDNFATSLSGVRLAPSVYCIPLSSSVTPARGAVAAWNMMARATGGHLLEGDAFFMHFAGNVSGMNSLCQVVRPGAHALSPVATGAQPP